MHDRFSRRPLAAAGVATSAKRLRAVAFVVAAALVPASFPAQVLAQAKATGPSKADLEKAKKAFFDGIEFENQKKWKEALEKFEFVAKVRMTPAVRFHIALCKENLGMLIEALHDFELAEADAKQEKVEAVMKEAPEHAAALKPRIPKLTIKIPADVEGASVTLDGNPIDPKGSEETLVNPGTHKIEATAEKRQAFVHEVSLGEGESKTVTVKLPPIEEEKKDEEPKKDEPPPPAPSSGPPVAALVVGGIGVLSLLGAGGFYLARNSVKRDLDEVCGADGQSCPPDREGAISNGKTYTLLTNVLGIVGVVGVGAGIVLFVTSSDDSPKPQSTGAIKLVPSAPGANIAGFSLTGAF